MAPPSDDLYSFLQGTELTPKPKSDVPIPDDSDANDANSSLSFDADGIGERLRHADEDELNEAPFGIIRLADDGTVEFYNRYESELSGVDPSDALGKNFFTQLAPCSNNQLFQGHFQDGVESGELDERFTYTFTYKMRPTLVDVRLYRDEAGQNWILIHKR
jgi:photoactive yellow protein